jgi:outer membrane protein assembly factor BamE (lipoprotein component of BamABCDE complex)
MRNERRQHVSRCGLAALLMAGLIAGCSPQVNKHGSLFSDSDIGQVQPGMTQDEVKQALGTPDTTSTIDGQVYYYISTTTTQSVAFLNPTITDRRIVAVYFSPFGTVDRLANYGLEDGEVVDFVSRKKKVFEPGNN